MVQYFVIEYPINKIPLFPLLFYFVETIYSLPAMRLGVKDVITPPRK